MEEEDVADPQRPPLIEYYENDSDSEGPGSVSSRWQAHFTRSNTEEDASRLRALLFHVNGGGEPVACEAVHMNNVVAMDAGIYLVYAVSY